MNLATSCNLVHALTFYNFSFPFGTYASRNRPCRPVPYGPMQRLCHPAHFFPCCCKSKLFNSKRKLQISNPRFPLLLFTLSNTQTHKLHYRSTSLSQDPLQSSNAVNLVKLHASLLVVQDVHSTWPKVRKGNPPGSTNITSIFFSDYVGYGTSLDHGQGHKQSRQTTLAIITTKTIELVSQSKLACRNLRAHPFIHPSTEVRYDCSKPKGNTCIQVVFTQSPVSLTTTPEYLPVLGFNVPSLHLSQVSQTTATIQVT